MEVKAVMDVATHIHAPIKICGDVINVLYALLNSVDLVAKVFCFRVIYDI